jgi:hypothetical protein
VPVSGVGLAPHAAVIYVVKRSAIIRKVPELEFTAREMTRMARAGDKHEH